MIVGAACDHVESLCVLSCVLYEHGDLFTWSDERASGRGVQTQMSLVEEEDVLTTVPLEATTKDCNLGAHGGID